jgi:hypothetical protein
LNGDAWSQNASNETQVHETGQFVDAFPASPDLQTLSSIITKDATGVAAPVEPIIRISWCWASAVEGPWEFVWAVCMSPIRRGQFEDPFVAPPARDAVDLADRCMLVISNCRPGRSL